MLAKETYLEDNEDYRAGYKIEVTIREEGATTLTFLEGEPEDATLGRDYSDVHKIMSLLELAYEAGRRNEPFIKKSENTTDLDKF